MYRSETSKVRHLVEKYCQGYGCDIGAGGDRIKKENCLAIDLRRPYAHTGHDRVDIPCDVIANEIPIDNDTFDYVYSSHFIEDAPDTTAVLRKMMRILKPEGTLVLVFPDQKIYERFEPKPNEHHKHMDMGLDFMMKRLSETKCKFETLFISDCQIDYNVIIVLKIIDKSCL